MKNYKLLVLKIQTFNTTRDLGTIETIFLSIIFKILMSKCDILLNYDNIILET